MIRPIDTINFLLPVAEPENDKRRSAFIAVLLDLEGEEVGQYYVESISDINFADLPRNIYIVQLYSAEGVLQTFKLVEC